MKKVIKVVLAILMPGVEVAVAAIILTGLPYIVGSYLNSYSGALRVAPDDMFRLWLGGLFITLLIACVLTLLHFIIFRAIPTWISYNLRMINKLLGLRKVYCHVCSKNAPAGAPPIYHMPPECKR